MFKDIKDKAEEKANDVKVSATDIGGKVAKKAKSLSEEATNLANTAVKTAAGTATNATKVAKGAIDSLVLQLATKIVIKAMKGAGRKGTSYIYNDERYGALINRTWEIFPLPIRLLGKEKLGYHDTMFTLRNAIFGEDDNKPLVDKKDEGTIKKTILGMFG